MTSRRPSEHEDVEAWRAEAATELTRLGSLTGAQMGAEVMRRGFAALGLDGERTRIGLANSLCPVAPSMLGGDDIDVVRQFDALLAPVLGALEDAGLLHSETRGRSALRFYGLTVAGRAALDGDGVQAILASRVDPGR